MQRLRQFRNRAINKKRVSIHPAKAGSSNSPSRHTASINSVESPAIFPTSGDALSALLD